MIQDTSLSTLVKRYLPKSAPKKYVIAFFALLVGACGGGTAMGQERISLKDAKTMVYAAQNTVDNLPRLLNYIATSTDLTDIKKDSYTNSPTGTQLFDDGGVIVEDDVTPTSVLGQAKDKTVMVYLDLLDAQYGKTPDPSINFSIPVISKIKKTKFFYVTARYDESFSSTYKSNGMTYETRPREALVRLYKLPNNQWKALIAGIRFYDPTSPADSPENDVQIAADESASAILISPEDFVKEKDDFLSLKRKEARANDVLFNDYIAEGVNYEKNQRYGDALDMYINAKGIKSLIPTLDKRILNAKKLLAENSYESLRSKADQAKGERRYVDALQLYKRAVVVKPEAHDAIEKEIILLTNKLDQISRPKNKLESGDLQGAIDECDNILKRNKGSKEDFPELYYLKGVAYQKMGEKQGTDARALNHALESYSKAIEYFTNYTDARLARADFYVKYKHNLADAITDYDGITNNTLNDLPEKAKYFVVKGKWKEDLKNYKGALDDFTKASLLDPQLAEAYLEKAELLSQLKQYDNAVKEFTSGIVHDDRHSRGYYGMALANLGLGEVNDAGDNFRQAEARGLADYQIQNIKSISMAFFDEGMKFFKLRNTTRADSLYDKSIAILPSNNKAWHGKAEVNFLDGTGLAFNPKSDAYKEQFMHAIELYNTAIKYNPTFSDAHYKIGMSYHQLGNYPAALTSFSQAIKIDANNVQAYMGRGFTNLTIKQYAQAVSDYTQAVNLLQLNIQNAKKNNKKDLVGSFMNDISQAYLLTGEAWYLNKSSDKALLSIAKSLEMNAKNAEAWYYQGLAFEALHDEIKAIKSYTEALKYAPNLKYYYANGRASLKLRKYDQAITNFSAVIKADTLPVIKNTYYLRGLSYFKSKSLDNAFKDFSSYAKIDAEKKDSLFYADFGWLNLYQNHDADAIDHFNQAIVVKSNNPQALYGLGCAYAKAGQFDKALDLIDKSFQTRQLKKEDIKLQEESFLGDMMKVKAHKSHYNQLKKTYLPSS